MPISVVFLLTRRSLRENPNGFTFRVNYQPRTSTPEDALESTTPKTVVCEAVITLVDWVNLLPRRGAHSSQSKTGNSDDTTSTKINPGDSANTLCTIIFDGRTHHLITKSSFYASSIEPNSKATISSFCIQNPRGAQASHVDIHSA